MSTFALVFFQLDNTFFGRREKLTVTVDISAAIKCSGRLILTIGRKTQRCHPSLLILHMPMTGSHDWNLTGSCLLWLSIPLSSCTRYRLSWLVAASATDSAAQVDKATVCRFLLFQDITGPFSVKLKQYPVVLLLSVLLAAQSAPLYPSSRRRPSLFWKCSSWSIVPFKNLGRCFGATQCCCFGSSKVLW